MIRLLILVALLPLFGNAQKLPTIEEKTKDLKKQEGFLPFYWDENSGKLWLEINKTESELLYITSLPAGLGSNDIGLDRGLLGNERIVRFSKSGRKMLLIQPNYRYRAVTSDMAEKRAVEQSFAQSVLWGFTIEAETNDRYLVDASDFILRDAMQVTSRLRQNQQGSYSFDKTRSALYLPRTKNFPLNTEFEATVTFTNNDGNTGSYVGSVTPSTEAITLRIHQSFVQLPDNDYQPRRYDPRSSYIPVSYYDYASPVSTPIEKSFIMRHRLKKKDPSAAMSEPVKPIIYYLDNGTPEPIRSALLEGAAWWNQAFEAAGYKDAFQVKVLPEDADPMDVRYNVINWVHRSTRGWSYGNSVTDPRTGEIIKGHVTLGSLRVRQDYLIATGLLAPFDDKNKTPANDKMLKMALERLKQLSAHEIGHTLGIMHNYAASVSDRASVMDYPHPLAKLTATGDIDLSSAYDNKIGEWDKVAITFGYQDFPAGSDESAALNKILGDAAKKGLQFITDQDARAPGGLHPQAHLWDNGTDAVSELKEVMKVRNKALKQFGEKNIEKGIPMAMLEDVLVPVYFYHRYQLEAVTKLVGGMYYSYAVKGDGQATTRPLSKEEQKKALNAVIDCLDPNFLVVPEHIVQLIPPRPPGYDQTRELFRKRTGLAFDVLSPAETAADLPLSLLFNSQRLNRMVQYEGQNNGLSLTEMINALADVTWKEHRYTHPSNDLLRLIRWQTAHVFLTYLLSASVNDNNSFAVKAILRKKLKELHAYIEEREKTVVDATYKAHLYLALERMKDPEKAKPTIHKEIPPGAPIGCDE
jgi:hypothetical protein